MTITMLRPPSETKVTQFLRDFARGGCFGCTQTRGDGPSGRIARRTSVHHAYQGIQTREEISWHKVASGWIWSSQSVAVAITTTERRLPQNRLGTARERRGPIPIDWVEGVACLDPDRPPNDVPRHRWRQFVDDCKNFLSPSENWAERAARLGWDAMALFGCAPKRPLDYLGSAGLVWAINGGRLLELHRDWAVIDVPVHGSQRIFYRRNVDAAKITLPWATPTSSRPPAALGDRALAKLAVPRGHRCPLAKSLPRDWSQ